MLFRSITLRPDSKDRSLSGDLQGRKANILCIGSIVLCSDSWALYKESGD